MGYGIKMLKLVDDLKPIAPAHEGEWIDLRAAEDITLEPLEYRRIHLGVAAALPEGYEAIIASRSSTFEKWGIIPVNGIGIVDNLYHGNGDEWSFPVVALRKTKIHKNDRICQFRIVRQQPPIDIVYVKELGKEDRGGFGSSGHK